MKKALLIVMLFVGLCRAEISQGVLPASTDSPIWHSTGIHFACEYIKIKSDSAEITLDKDFLNLKDYHHITFEFLGSSETIKFIREDIKKYIDEK